MKNLLVTVSIVFCALLFASCSAVQKTSVAQSESSQSIHTSSSSANAKDQIRNKLIAELLSNRLKIDVIREVGSRHACEPQEPYYRLNVSLRYFEQAYDVEKDERYAEERLEETTVAQGIVLIESTGEVGNMPACFE